MIMVLRSSTAFGWWACGILLRKTHVKSVSAQVLQIHITCNIDMNFKEIKKKVFKHFQCVIKWNSHNEQLQI